MAKTILLVFGTRPEAIKLAPLIKKLQEQPKNFNTLVCVTGQHREMLDQVLNLFEIKPDFDLDIMRQNQDLYDITSSVLLGVRNVLNTVNVDMVLVHGDTTTSMAAGIAAFYKQIPVGHIEAGLRTHNIYNPFPEEANRQITSRVTSIHFAPTNTARNNLRNEGIEDSQIFVTGNTVIDALRFITDKIKENTTIKEKLENEIAGLGYTISGNKRTVLITGHRRENFGEGFLNICNAIVELAEKYLEVDFVYPVHLNPNVRKPVSKLLGTIDNKKVKNVYLLEPLEYLPFVYLMSKSYLILTDSGGIQEEAPGLGKPVLVMRETTERPEAVDAGTVKLVGTDKDKIVSEVSDLLNNTLHYNAMSNTANPYGDGQASEKIVNHILNQKQWD